MRQPWALGLNPFGDSKKSGRKRERTATEVQSSAIEPRSKINSCAYGVLSETPVKLWGFGPHFGRLPGRRAVESPAALCPGATPEFGDGAFGLTGLSSACTGITLKALATRTADAKTDIFLKVDLVVFINL